VYHPSPPSECTGVYINPAPWSLDLNRLCYVSPSFHSSGLLTGRWEYVSVRNRALFWPSGVERSKSFGEASRVAGGDATLVALRSLLLFMENKVSQSFAK